MKYYTKERYYGEITKIKCQLFFSPFTHEYKLLKEMFPAPLIGKCSQLFEYHTDSIWIQGFLSWERSIESL